MSEVGHKPGVRYSGEAHRGAGHAAPYPLSRLAPAVELVDLAREIAQADQTVHLRVNAQMQVIAEQIRALQEQARGIMEKARLDEQLHHAYCGFRRLPGKTYHLYRQPDGSLRFSMLAPADWGGEPPAQFCGSYRLENDMSWTAVEQG